MNNYEYCAAWARSRGGRILDYGCGAGQVVALLRNSGLDAYGCDVYLEGEDLSAGVPPELMGTAIKRMQDARIPFDDGMFNVITTNMVMEHVADLDAVLDEIRRVLRPGGVLLCLFPHRGVWIEGHCRIPFLHLFRKGSRLRIYYAALLSWLGIGARDRSKESALAWSRRICGWLDRWTYYRTSRQIVEAFGSRFDGPHYLEEQWLRARFGDRAKMAYALPVTLQRFLVRGLGAMAFTCVKR